VSNKTLLLQFRPKLIVRNVVINPIEVIKGQPEYDSILITNFPVFGQFYIVNVGGTDATVTEVYSEVTWQYFALPMKRPYEGKVGNILSKPAILRSGQSMPWRFDSAPVLDINPYRIKQPEDWKEVKERRRLYVLGFVVYADDLGFERRTAFCRYLNPATQRFTAVEEDPDYEHAE
jgi:hypothetical protein